VRQLDRADVGSQPAVQQQFDDVRARGASFDGDVDLTHFGELGVGARLMDEGGLLGLGLGPCDGCFDHTHAAESLVGVLVGVGVEFGVQCRARVVARLAGVTGEEVIEGVVGNAKFILHVAVSGACQIGIRVLRCDFGLNGVCSRDRSTLSAIVQVGSVALLIGCAHRRSGYEGDLAGGVSTGQFGESHLV
jgi:hypothetical protein